MRLRFHDLESFIRSCIWLSEVRKSQVRYLSYLGNSLNFKAQNGYQPRVDRLEDPGEARKVTRIVFETFGCVSVEERVLGANEVNAVFSMGSATMFARCIISGAVVVPDVRQSALLPCRPILEESRPLSTGPPSIVPAPEAVCSDRFQ